jgi:hypothetical protein
MRPADYTVAVSSGFRDRAGATRRIDSIARSKGGFGGLLRETEAYIALNKRIAHAVPASARGEIGIACVEGDCLVIAATSSARATQARLAADAILEAAQRCWPRPLKRTRIVVAPGTSLAT